MADGWDAWGADGVSPVQAVLEKLSPSSSRSTTPQPAKKQLQPLAEAEEASNNSTGWTANTPYTSLPPQYPPQRRSPIQSPTSAAPPSRQYPPQIPTSPAPSFTQYTNNRGKGEISIAGRASGSQIGSINRPPSENGSQKPGMSTNAYRGGSMNGDFPISQHPRPSTAAAPSAVNNGWSTTSPSSQAEARNHPQPPSPSFSYHAVDQNANGPPSNSYADKREEEAARSSQQTAAAGGGGGGWEAAPAPTQNKSSEEPSGWDAPSSTSVPFQSNSSGNDGGWGAPASNTGVSTSARNGFENNSSNTVEPSSASFNGGWGSSAPSNGNETGYNNGDSGYGAQSSSYGAYDTSGGAGGGYSNGYGNGGSGGGSRACFNCGQEGHRSAECSEARKNSSMTCYNCGETGHGSRDCSAPRKEGGGGGGGGACFNCGEAGHNSRDCTNPRAERKPEVTIDPPGFLKGAIIGSGCCHLKDLSSETGAYVSLHKPDAINNPDYKVIAIFKKHNESMEIVENALKILVGRIKEREGGWMPEGKALEMWNKIQEQGGNSMSSWSGERQNGYGDSQPRNSYNTAPTQSQWGGAPSQPSQPSQSTSGGWGASNPSQSQPPNSHERRPSGPPSEAGFTYPSSNHGGSALARSGLSVLEETALAQMAQAFAQQEKGFETARAAHAPHPSSGHGREKTSDSGFASSYNAPDSNVWYGPSSDNIHQAISPSREMNASARSFTPKANTNGSTPPHHENRSNNYSQQGNVWEASAPVAFSTAMLGNGRDRSPSIVSHRLNDRARAGSVSQNGRQDSAVNQSRDSNGGDGWEMDDKPAPPAAQSGWGSAPSQSNNQKSPSSIERSQNAYASPPSMSSVQQANHTIRSALGSERGGEHPSAAPVASGWNAGLSAPAPNSSSSGYARQNDAEDISARMARSSISDERRREESPPAQAAAAAATSSGWDVPEPSTSATKGPSSGWEEATPASSSHQAPLPSMSTYESASSHHQSPMQRAPPAQDQHFHSQSNGWSNAGGYDESPRTSQAMNDTSGGSRGGWNGDHASSRQDNRNQSNGHTNGYSASANGCGDPSAHRSSYGDTNNAPAPPRSEVGGGSVRSGNGSINPGWAASSRGPLPPQNAAFGGNSNGPPMNGYSGGPSSYGGGNSYGGNRGYSSGGGGGGYGYGGNARSGGNEIELRNNRWGRPTSSSNSVSNAPPPSNIPSLPGSGW